MRVVVVACLGLFLCLPSAAGAVEKKMQLVGFTTASVDSDVGIFGFTVACQAEFPASRMCSSRELMETVALPQLGTFANGALVRPVFLAHGSNSFPFVDDSVPGGFVEREKIDPAFRGRLSG